MRISKSLFVACALASCAPAEPEPADDVATVVEDGSVRIEVRANDRHVDRISAFSGARHGMVHVVGDAIQYTPNPDFTGTDEFEYVGYRDERDSDEHSFGVSASVTVTVTPDRAAQLTQDVMSPAWPDSVAIADFDRLARGWSHLARPNDRFAPPLGLDAIATQTLP